MPSLEEMKESAFDYADFMRGAGYHSVQVFRYITTMDRYDPWNKNHNEQTGYAIRCSGIPNWAPDAPPKDEALIVFTDDTSDYGVPHAKFTGGHAGILADDGVNVTPYYVASWSTSESQAIAATMHHEITTGRPTSLPVVGFGKITSYPGRYVSPDSPRTMYTFRLLQAFPWSHSPGFLHWQFCLDDADITRDVSARTDATEVRLWTETGECILAVSKVTSDNRASWRASASDYFYWSSDEFQQPYATWYLAMTGLLSHVDIRLPDM